MFRWLKTCKIMLVSTSFFSCWVCLFPLASLACIVKVFFFQLNKEKVSFYVVRNWKFRKCFGCKYSCSTSRSWFGSISQQSCKNTSKLFCKDVDIPNLNSLRTENQGRLVVQGIRNSSQVKNYSKGFCLHASKAFALSCSMDIKTQKERWKTHNKTWFA